MFKHVYHKHIDHNVKNQHNKCKESNPNEKALSFQFYSCVPTDHAQGNAYLLNYGHNMVTNTRCMEGIQSITFTAPRNYVNQALLDLRYMSK